MTSCFFKQLNTQYLIKLDAVQEIKNRLTIVEVVSDYVQLKPAGKNFKALCPFHNDHTPSMVVSPEREMAWCFACNNGGDIFGFVEKIENISFSEALRLLAEKANVKLPDYNPEKKEKRDRISEILEVATEKFEHNFWTNKLAQDEVFKRKISEKTLKQFKIGFAWKGEHEMEKYLLEHGFSRKEMIDAGLSVPEDSKGEKARDKFRSRIMFPFFNKTGVVVGYSARAFGDFDPKYLNSPETEVFKKSEILFGYNFAKKYIKEEDFTLVVEGQFDCISCVDHDVKNVVAASGTAFSESHAKQMLKLSKNIVFALDADVAGIVATKRSISIAIEAGAEVFVVELPEGKDPDDLLRENEEIFFDRLRRRKSAMDFFFELAFKDRDPNNLKHKGEIFEDLFPVISKFPKKFEQDAYLVKLAENLNVDLNAIRQDFKSFDKTGYRKRPARFSKPDRSEIADSQAPNKNQISKREFFVGILMAFPELCSFAKDKIVDIIFPECQEKKLYEKLKEICSENEKLDIDEAFKEFTEEDREKWNLVTLFAEEKTEKIPESIRIKEFKKLVAQINHLNFQETQKKLLQKMKDAKEGSSDQNDLYRQLTQLASLAKNF